MYTIIYVCALFYVTYSSPRCPLRSYSLECIKNHFYIVGIGPILNKELELIFDLIALIVCASIVRYKYYTINNIYINVMKSVFLDIKM